MSYTKCLTLLMVYIDRDYTHKPIMRYKLFSYVTPVVFFSRKNAREIIHKVCTKDLYTGKVLHGRHWTLEHIVPQSLISTDGKKNDLHNLAGVESVLNSSRGNKKFGDSMISYKIYEECKISKNLFSPFTGKGDSARVCAYMMETYGGSIDKHKLIEDETILRWNYENPPSDYEKRKNEFIYKLQGTYNRFVDNHQSLQEIINIQSSE